MTDSLPCLAQLPIRQLFCSSRQDLKAALDDFCRQYDLKGLVLVTDGVFKRAAVDSSKDIAAVMIELLKEFSLEVQLISFENCLKNPLLKATWEICEYLKEQLLPYTRLNNSCAPQWGFVALGSGTITDLTKHALYNLNHSSDVSSSNFKQPLLVLPTALTVTAYTSCTASLENQREVKQSFNSQLPDVVCWYEPVLAAAPRRYLRAGFGDALAVCTSLLDWRLADFFGLSSTYQTKCAQLLQQDLKQLVPLAKQISEAEFLPASLIQTFVKVLSNGGLVTSFVNSSEPLSGFEHTISHILDEHHQWLHGEQVALATLTSSYCYEWLFQCQDRGFFKDGLTQRWKRLFQEKIKHCGGQQKYEHLFTNLLQDDFLPRWKIFLQEVKQGTISPTQILTWLNEAHLPTCPEELEPPLGAQAYRHAIARAPFLRNRFGVGDLLWLCGEDVCAAGLA